MASSEPRIIQNYSVPNTTGSTIPFNDIGTAPRQILEADPGRADFIVYNPSDVDILIYQGSESNGAAFTASFLNPGGGVVLLPGSDARINGEASQSPWYAIARSGSSNSLTIILKSDVRLNSASDAGGGAGAGYMLKPTYDPENKQANVYDGNNLDDRTIGDIKLDTSSKVYSRATYERNILDFIPFNLHASIINWTSSDDHLPYLQAAADSGLLVFFPPGRYNVSNTLQIKNGTKFIGAGAFWKARTGYTAPQAKVTTIRYIGSTGTNTCVVNVSRKAVGVVGTNFTPPNGDDLVGVVLRDINVDANNLADIGWNMYRCGNTAGITRLTAEKAVKRNFIMNGLFSLRDGVFGAYESEDIGASAGIDYFGWNSVEARIFDCQMAFDLNNNGTSATYQESSNSGSGGFFRCERGSVIEVTSQINEGFGMLIQPSDGNSTQGPAIYVPRYIEGNGNGIKISPYTAQSDNIILRDGFIHPGNGGSLAPQNIRIAAYSADLVYTTNEGPADAKDWLRLEDLKGAFGVISNTYKFKVKNCDKGNSFSGIDPASQGIHAAAFFRANAGLTDTRKLIGGTLSRVSTPAYRLVFDREMPDTNYFASAVPDTLGMTHYVTVANKNTAFCEIRFYTLAAPTIPVDPDIFADFTVYRYD